MMKHVGLLILLVSLCFAALPMSGQNAMQEVTGKVTTKSHEPLAGVTVLVKGESGATMTDAEGDYRIKVSVGKQLEYRYVGYTTQVIKVQSRIINVVMQESETILNDLVVIGYGKQKKSDLTGSLSSINQEDLGKSGAANLSQAIQGKAAGVYVTSNSGAPGSGATIRVRGYGSISTDLTPLYVVDGQPIGESQFNNINPQDIENIEILKDASACAIYGSRGANGIVLVTTKRGKSGKTSINLDVSWGWSHSINRVKMMNSDQLYGFLSEAYKNDGLKMPRNIKNLYYLDGKGLGPVDENGDPTDINVYDTDWWKECTRTGQKQSYNLSIGGGTDKLKSHFSIGYLSQDGIVKTSDYSRITMRTNNEYAFNRYITVGQTLGGAYTKMHDLNMSISEILLADPFSPIYAANADTQDPNYEYNKYMGSQYSYYHNPVAGLNRQKKEHTNRDIDGTAYMNINLVLKGLYYKLMLGFDLPTYDYKEFNPSFDLRPNDSKYNMCTDVERKYNLRNSVQNASSSSVNYTLQNLLNYDNSFGKHNISAMLGYTWESYHYKTHSGIRFDLPSNNPNFQILDAATADDVARGYEWESNLISYLGRLNYNYDNRYLLTATVRRDGSSKFAKGHRWGTFPSFSLGWRIDQEDFFKEWKQDIITTLKLRGGWGQNGNQNIPTFAYVSTVSTYPTWIYGFNGGKNTLQAYGMTSIGNPNIKWETSEQGNIGLDMSFFRSALTLSADAYVKTTRDMLMQNPLPSMSGYTSTPWTNAGTVRNKGIELLIGYKGAVSDFTYAVNANFTFQKNKLVATGTNDAIWGSVSKNEIGQEFGRFYGYVYDGIFQNEDEIKAHVGADGKTLLQPNAHPGDARFKNLNNDNALNSDDRDYIGNPNPKLIYGGSVTLGYKGIDLAVYFQGVAGNDIWVGTKMLQRHTSMTNLLAETYTGAWRQEGDKTDIFYISRKDDNENYRGSSWFVQNGSFCKIKTFQLGYTIPKNVLAKTKVIAGMRLYLSGENLFTITKFKYMDPEVPNGNPLSLGIENLGYPNPRTFTLGLNIQF